MHEIYELKEMLMKELEEYGRKRDMSTGTLEVVDKLAHTIKNLCKIIEAAEEEEEGYSGRGGSYRGSSGGSYGSYARGGRGGQGGGSNRSGAYRGGSYEGGYEGGSYARGRGRNARRDSMGRYSSEMGYSGDPAEMADQLREIMEQAPDENIRRGVERLLRQVEEMQ